MNENISVYKSIDYDVVVVGGGTAGVFAAISAARNGASTLLLEKNSTLGGTMTVADVNFPGLFFAWGKQIISGPCWEAIERTIKLGGGKMPEIPYEPYEHWNQQILLNRFIYTAVLFEMCEEAGVHIICNSMISSAKETESGVKIIATEKKGIFRINAGCVIDATGDANLCEMCGFDVVKSKELQPATLRNHIRGYDIEKVSVDEIKEKLENADFPSYITADLLFRCLCDSILDIHIPCGDADTSEGKTQLEQDAYRLLLRIYKFLREIKGLENLEVDFVAEETGVRETNRIVGETTVTSDDYINGKKYSDSVCFAFYPIDLHMLDGIKMVYHKENIVPEVPYSSLVPGGAKSVIACGRCISSDKNANSALRVQAVCMATGQVAGCAAALKVKTNKNVSEIEYTKLTESLENIGAIVPK